MRHGGARPPLEALARPGTPERAQAVPQKTNFHVWRVHQRWLEAYGVAVEASGGRGQAVVGDVGVRRVGRGGGMGRGKRGEQ